MRKLRLYLETSLFGFYFDERERNVEKKEAVIKLFEQIRAGRVEGFISDMVLKELRESPDQLNDMFSDLIKENGIKEFEFDEEEVQSLSVKYVEEGVIPARYANDAIHAANATVGGFDILVTLNCAHLANEFRIRKIRLINFREGYTKELSIRTPMEVIDYDD
jgi:hypothetical protein